jgi:hypothetical protein
LRLIAPGLAGKRLNQIQNPEPPPERWDDWLRALFPNLFYAPFAPHHAEFWEHVESVRPGVKPPAFVAIWARGGAKTTNAEAAVVRLGVKLPDREDTPKRHFCLYVRATQDKANESVQNIAAMLESQRMERHHPDMASRKLSKYGHSRGWRVDVLRCASGFSVIGLGLDAAVRGVKIEEFRPDVIVLDDVDDKQDSDAAVEKKIDTITTGILPAGSADAAVIGIQNVMHAGSVFGRIADGSADFLHDRVVSGPHPAVRGLEYEQRPGGGYRIVGGEPTWAGQDLETCEAQINGWGPTAFLHEAQHEVEDLGGVWDQVEFRRCGWGEVPELARGCVWCDPAVTNTDRSDNNGIQADGLGADGVVYRMYSWEGRASPEDVLKRAMLKAVELKFEAVGVETDQGGDLWRTAYGHAWAELVAEGRVPEDARKPTFKEAKAGAGHGSKAHRNGLMLAGYEQGKVVHVRGTHQALERALRRFPRKPLDLADASYWGWNDLARKGVFVG